MNIFTKGTKPDWCPLSPILFDLKLYLLTQEENNGYDTFDSCVVAAYRRSRYILFYIDLKKIVYHLMIMTIGKNLMILSIFIMNNGKTWATSPNNVKCKFIGYAEADIIPNSVVCSSFNAG